MNATYRPVTTAGAGGLRRVLNNVKYARYMGRTFRFDGANMNALKLELERALAPLRDEWRALPPTLCHVHTPDPDPRQRATRQILATTRVRVF